MLEQVDVLIRKVQDHPDPEVREMARELVRTLLGFHREVIRKSLELVPEDVATRLASDALVSRALLLHGLHPEALTDRVERALEKVRPYLGSHGGSVELLGVDEGRIRIRLQGSCQGCPSSEATVRGALEEAILAEAPDAEALEVV